MAKWKIREVRQQNYITLDVNPSNYGRKKEVNAQMSSCWTAASVAWYRPLPLKRKIFN